MLENPMHMMLHKYVKCHLQNSHIFYRSFIRIDTVRI